MRVFKDSAEVRSHIPGEYKYTDWRAVIGEGDENPDIIVVKQKPHGWDVEKNKPLLGTDGISIRTGLLKKGIKYYATNAFPFYRGSQDPTSKDAEATRDILTAEISALKTRKILCLGVNAARWTGLFGHPIRKFTDVVGRNIESNGLTFRVVHAPMALASNPNLYNEFLRGLDELIDPQIVKNKRTRSTMERYANITSRDEARALLKKMKGPIAADFEATGTDPYTAIPLTLSFSNLIGTGYTMPWTLFTPEEWVSLLFDKELIWQNGSYDVKLAAGQGIWLPLAHDTILMHSLVDETPGTHSMEHMAHRYLGIDKWGDTVDYDAFKYGLSGMENPEGVEEGDQSQSFETVGRYAARDVDITLRLYETFKPRVAGKYANTVLHNSQRAIIRSEMRGIRIDRDRAFELRDAIEKTIHDRQQYLADVYGLENPNSVNQVKALLYDQMGVPVQKKKNSITTASEYIEPFASEHPVISNILEYRSLVKANSTYLKNIIEKSERTGRYHPEFKLANTETGRLAESLILLLPRPDNVEGADMGKQFQYRLRELFIPDEGHLMIGADYSGLEVGMAGLVSGDKQLIEDFNEGRDTHSIVAIEAFGLDIPLEPYSTLKKRVSATNAYERTLAKFGTFTFFYGGGADAIAQQLGVSLDIAQSIIDGLSRRYPIVVQHQKNIVQKARTEGQVMTPWGRIRRFVYRKGLSRMVEQEQDREAINCEIQSHGNDMTLEAYSRIEAQGIQTLWPFHDAVYAQAPEDTVEKDMKSIKEIMETVIQQGVHFKADVKAGPNWAMLG